MSDILENELVKKYFGDIQDWHPGEKVAGVPTHGCMAQRIIHAMQEPLKKGDLFLAELVALVKKQCPS